jgi:hypothetical protein
VTPLGPFSFADLILAGIFAELLYALLHGFA